MMSGCGVTDPVSAPSITVSTIGSITAGTFKDVTGKIEAGEAITAVTYSIVDPVTGTAPAGITVTGPTSSTDKTMEFTATSPIRITVASTASSGSYKLKISAIANATAEASFDFTVTGGSSLLAVTATGKIANIYGPDLGAYDLVSSARIAASGSATLKDLKDLSLVGAGFGGKIGTGNGALFAIATSTDYTNATTASVKALGNAATDTSVAIAAGTVFAVKLGNSRGYAIVKILTYDATAGASAAGNKGEATFEYKFTL
jgi:hypothetical protein